MNGISIDRADFAAIAQWVKPGARVPLVDDLLATGGTAAAAVSLLRKIGANILEANFLIELGFLDGRKKLRNIPVHSLVNY